MKYYFFCFLKDHLTMKKFLAQESVQNRTVDQLSPWAIVR